jgi:hypothetical protein
VRHIFIIHVILLFLVLFFLIQLVFMDSLNRVRILVRGTAEKGGGERGEERGREGIKEYVGVTKAKELGSQIRYKRPEVLVCTC